MALRDGARRGVKAGIAGYFALPALCVIGGIVLGALTGGIALPILGLMLGIGVAFVPPLNAPMGVLSGLIGGITGLFSHGKGGNDISASKDNYRDAMAENAAARQQAAMIMASNPNPNAQGGHAAMVEQSKLAAGRTEIGG